MEQKFGLSTVKKHLGTLRRVWKAVNAGQVWEGVKAAGKDGWRYRRLAVTEVRELIKESNLELRAGLLLGYYTGMRLKNVVLLKREE